MRPPIHRTASKDPENAANRIELAEDYRSVADFQRELADSKETLASFQLVITISNQLGSRTKITYQLDLLLGPLGRELEQLPVRAW